MVYLSIFILGRPFVFVGEMMNKTVTVVKGAILRKIAVIKF